MYFSYCFVVSFLFFINQVHGQATPQIVKQEEKVVRKTGASATINCTVANIRDDSNTNEIEWRFLNGTSGGRVISRNCKVVDDHNVAGGIEKYIIRCPPQVDPTRKVFSLTIQSLQVPDNGFYQCSVRIENNPGPSSNMAVEVQVLSPPTVIPASTDLRKDSFIGLNATLKCTATGIPAPNVTWGRANGKPLPQGRHQFIPARKAATHGTETSRTLHLFNLTKEDRGTYRCSADNNVRPYDSYLSLLNIEFPPTVSAVEPSYGVATNGAGQGPPLWCQVEGYPAPTVSWYSVPNDLVDEIRTADPTTNEIERIIERANSELNELVSDNVYSIEQKVMVVGSLSTMQSMFYSLTLKSIESSNLGYYLCRGVNSHGQGHALIQLYEVNLQSYRGSSAINLYPLTLTLFTSFVVVLINRL